MTAKRRNIEFLLGWLYDMRDGRIARIRDYATRAEALEAAGIEAPDWS